MSSTCTHISGSRGTIQAVGSYLDSQTVAPQQGFTYNIYHGGMRGINGEGDGWWDTAGSGNRNRTIGDSIFHCHPLPALRSGHVGALACARRPGGRHPQAARWSAEARSFSQLRTGGRTQDVPPGRGRPPDRPVAGPRGRRRGRHAGHADPCHRPASRRGAATVCRLMPKPQTSSNRRPRRRS